LANSRSRLSLATSGLTVQVSGFIKPARITGPGSTLQSKNRITILSQGIGQVSIRKWPDHPRILYAKRCTVISSGDRRIPGQPSRAERTIDRSLPRKHTPPCHNTRTAPPGSASHPDATKRMANSSIKASFDCTRMHIMSLLRGELFCGDDLRIASGNL
jgi:hypothetical protein